MNTFINHSEVNLKHQKYYFVQGKHEDEDMEAQTQRVIENLKSKNVKSKNIFLKIDETLNKIFEKTGKSVIVVGIDNGGEKRIEELSPYKNAKYGGGNGDNYVKFIVETLAYRDWETDRKSTRLNSSHRSLSRMPSSA